MNFVDGLLEYFTRVLDLTSFISYFLVATGFVIYLWPKHFNKQKIIKLSLVFVIGYIALVVLPAFGFALGSLMSNEYSSVSSLLFSIVVPLIVLVFSLIFTKAKKGYGLHKFIKTIILFASIFIVGVLSKNTGFLIGTVTNDIFILVSLARSLPYACFTAFCFLLNRININHYRNLSKEIVIINTTLSLLLIVISVSEHMYFSHDKMMNGLLSFFDAVLLFLLGFSYYATYKNIENRHKITNLEVQKTLEGAERMSLEIDQVNREELQKLRHDIKNQFSYLNILIEQGKYDEASKFINEYINNNKEILNSFSCSNNVINSIVNLELTKAKIKGIKIDVKVVVPPLLPYNDIDMVSLITNMIDNAIENFYSTEENKSIVVRMYKQNDFIRITVSNPIDKENVSIRNLKTTTKRESGHGYGTKIIKNIVKAYGGYVDFNIEGDIFVCDALLSLEIKGKEEKDA